MRSEERGREGAGNDPRPEPNPGPRSHGMVPNQPSPLLSMGCTVFFSSAMSSECTEALEAKSFCITSIYNLLTNNQYERRLKDSCFGFTVNNKLKELTPDLTRRCKAEFVEVYERALKYLRERYEFSEHSFHSQVAKLSLQHAVPFEQFCEAVKPCNVDVDMD